MVFKWELQTIELTMSSSRMHSSHSIAKKVYNTNKEGQNQFRMNILCYEWFLNCLVMNICLILKLWSKILKETQRILAKNRFEFLRVGFAISAK